MFPDPNPPAEAARAGTYTLPGSTKSYTQKQIDDLKSAPDWYPQTHPAPPTAVVKGGAGPVAWACGECHLISGMGHPESASLAGQPAAYLERQMEEFRSGARAYQLVIDGKPVVDTVGSMNGVAKAWSDAEGKAAVEYFAGLKPQTWVKVVESATAPKSFVDAGYMRVQSPGGAAEPLGQRIVELPQDLERALLRDPNSGTVAYVPVGAIARGKALAAAGPLPCAACHGAELKGQGEIPGIAGRSPVYNFRQLYFFKGGARNGAMAALMKGPVAALSEKDMIDLAAYLASLTP
jgi:cytochrome c553